MTEQEYKTLKQIIADAPECTELFNITLDGDYVPLFQCDESGEWLCWTGFDWSTTDLEAGEQLVKPDLIKAIIEQEEWIETVEKANSNLSDSLKYNEKKQGELLEICTYYKKLRDELKSRIAELEQEKQTLIDHEEMWKQQWHELNDSIEHQLSKGRERRDFEQQARGIEDFIKLFSFYYSEQDADFIYSEDAISYCARLRKQAAKLKEHKDND